VAGDGQGDADDVRAAVADPFGRSGPARNARLEVVAADVAGHEITGRKSPDEKVRCSPPASSWWRRASKCFCRTGQPSPSRPIIAICGVNRSKRDALAQARFRSCPPTQRRRLRPGRRRVGGCSVNHCPEHPAQSDATDEEGVLRQACAADVRQPDERHEASLPRRPAAAACDRAKSVPQNETIGSRLFSFNRAANGGIASFAVEGLEARIKARFLGCLVFRTRQVH